MTSTLQRFREKVSQFEFDWSKFDATRMWVGVITATLFTWFVTPSILGKEAMYSGWGAALNVVVSGIAGAGYAVGVEWLRRLRGALRALATPARPGSVQAAAHSLDVLSAIVPKRIADEEIGDAMEAIHNLVTSGRPQWVIHLKIVTTWFCVLWHSLCDTCLSLADIAKRSKGGDD